MGGDANPELDIPTGDWTGRQKACKRGDIHKSHRNSLKLLAIKWEMMQRFAFGRRVGRQVKEKKSSGEWATAP